MTITEIKNLTSVYLSWTCIIHCPTKKEAYRVLALLKEAGFTVNYDIENEWNGDGMKENFCFLPTNRYGKYTLNHDSLKSLLDDTDFKKLPLFNSTDITRDHSLDDILDDLDQRIYQMEQRQSNRG